MHRLLRRRRARIAWLTLLVVCFCLFEDSLRPEFCSSRGNFVSFGIESESNHVYDINAVAEHPASKWLRWEKTRAEVFGPGQEAWHESWALPYIFDDISGKRQTYLWAVLCTDRHLHVGTGILSIPGDWKKRARARRRMQIHHRKAKSCIVRHGSQRGGGTEHEMDL